MIYCNHYKTCCQTVWSIKGISRMWCKYRVKDNIVSNSYVLKPHQTHWIYLLFVYKLETRRIECK